MYQIVFASKAKDLSHQEINEILTVSYNHNGSKNISGALIYVQGYFIEAITGYKSAIEKTYEHIKKDTRHEDVITISASEIQEPPFQEWSMSFVNPSAYKNIIEPIVKTKKLNPYFLDKDTVLQILKEVSSQL